MYNQEINEFYVQLISTTQNNLNSIKEYTNYIDNALHCLMGFFNVETTKKENNIKMPLIQNYQLKGEDTMKFKGKTIFKNKKCNTWYTRYRKDGKQYYISGKTQKEVVNELKRILDYTPKEKKRYTQLIEWYYKWLELFKIGKVKQSTIRDYEKSLKHISNEILNKDITKITSIEIINELNKISLERTRQKVYEFLKALFDTAKKHSLTNNNIMDIIEKPKHQKEKGIALTQSEQIKFINFCKNYKYGDLFLLTMYQGLRIGEVLALSPKDIDITNKKLTINKSLNEKSEIDTTKNYQSIRTIPIFDNTLEILKKYKNSKSTRIFNFTYSVPQKHIKTISNTLSIREISPHDLRHTFITNCKNKGIPEHIIQTWVGHKIGSKVTSTVYTHTNEEDTIKYINKYNLSD